MEYTPTLPPQPTTNASILEPSAEFRKQASKVTKALISFIVIYILLSLSALVIALAMMAVGVFLIIGVHIIVAIILGLGFILSGLMLIFFFVKSIFIKLPGKASLYETKEENQPELFSFIRQLTKEIGTPFPKHIYLSNEVNAAVFLIQISEACSCQPEKTWLLAFLWSTVLTNPNLGQYLRTNLDISHSGACALAVT